MDSTMTGEGRRTSSSIDCCMRLEQRFLRVCQRLSAAFGFFTSLSLSRHSKRR